MSGIISLNNVKTELSLINSMLRLRGTGMHSITSNSVIRTAGLHTVPRQATSFQPITIMMSKKLNENVRNYTTKNRPNNASAEALILDSDLKTFLTDCVWNKKEDNGFNALSNYRKQNKFNVINLECCHILMEIYARQANFERISQIYDMMKQDGCKAVAQTYVFILECLAKMEWSDKVLNLLKNCVEDATKNNISLNDIFEKSIFVRDQRQLILGIIHKTDEQFQPAGILPDLNYSNKLLQALNSGSTDRSTQTNFTSDELRSFAKEQMEIESQHTITIDDVSTPFTESTSALKEFCRKKLDELYAAWHTQICEIFTQKLICLQNKAEISEENIFMCLTLFKPEQYADLILDALKEFIQSYGGNEATSVQLHFHIGRKVNQRHEWELRKADGVVEKTTAIYDKYCDEITSNRNSQNFRQKWQRLEFADRNLEFYKEYHEWSDYRCVQVGQFLFEILKENIQINENLFDEAKRGKELNEPILRMGARKREMGLSYEINPILLRLHHGAERKTMNFTPKQMPTLCPPLPWTSIRKGGYLLRHSPFLRSKEDTAEILTAINQTPSTELYPVLDNLNQCSNVAWRINSRVLDIVTEIYNEKFSDNQLEKIVNMQKNIRTSKQRVAQKLSLANYLRNKTFWFPHNRESRGRIFAMSSLSYSHSDLQRSLLTFHERKPLGDNGLKWLKLHCVNLTKSKSHANLADRLKYADQCMDDILDSADNPLTGRLWWLNSSKPFQTLACCIEIADAIRSPDPSSFLSGLPVHQDGSCNGLQHYAALSRDKELATSVNLSYSEKPQDAYSIAIDLVERDRAKDAKNGLEIAKLLENCVTRCLLKTSIVSNIYGGSRNRPYIKAALHEIPTFPKPMIKPGAVYLEFKYKNISALLFKPAQEISMWLKKSAFFISENCGKSVQWLTPLNIPVVIPYDGTLNINENKSFDATRYFSKTVTAFPPNFVMSLESSHMLLTSLNCEAAGVTFTSEHDSFATHAATVDQMNKICREQFLLLHSQPILENLSDYFCEKYLTNDSKPSRMTKQDVHIFNGFPKTGDFDLREVLNSQYFFS